MRARLLPVVLAATALAVAPHGADAASAKRLAAQKVKRPPAGEVYWGAYRAPAPYSRPTLHSLERDAGRRPAIVMWYQEWSGQPDFPIADATRVRRRGEVPMLSWEAWDPSGRVVNQPQYGLKRIAAGAFDPFIKRYARTIKKYGGPLMLRPFHEMDGTWYPWAGAANGNTPADFVAAWRHVHKVFDRVGARNVTWVWSVNGTSVPDTAENQIPHYWPGKKYVDWIGISAFNYVGSLGGTNTGWSYLGPLLVPRLNSLKPYRSTPIMITETATVEDGGDKAAWIRALPTDLLGGPVPVRGFVWYDQRESTAQNFPFTSSAASQAAFRSTVAGRHVASAPSAMRHR